MDDVSFDLEENLDNTKITIEQPLLPDNKNHQPPPQIEKVPSTKKPSKISINLKPKLLPQPIQPEINSMYHQSSQDMENRGFEEARIEKNEGEHKEEMVVPEFLLGGKGNTGNTEASTSAIMRQVFPNRYFILKKLSRGLLEVCMETNYCVILVAYKKRLHDAYQVKITNCIDYYSRGRVYKYNCSSWTVFLSREKKGYLRVFFQFFRGSNFLGWKFLPPFRNIFCCIVFLLYLIVIVLFYNIINNILFCRLSQIFSYFNCSTERGKCLFDLQ